MTSKQVLGCARWAMILILACAMPCQGQTRAEASNAWDVVLRDIPSSEPGFQFALVPEGLYSNLAALAEGFKKFEYEPSREEVEEAWRARGPQEEELTETNVVKVKRFLRRVKYRRSHAEAIQVLRKAAGKNLYQRLVADGIVPSNAPACFVFVPLPCPSQETYAKATSFMLSACDVAQEDHLSAVIVRSYYGDAESVKKPLDRGQWWNSQILEMPTEYAQFIESGAVKIVDSFPGGTVTPWAFLFRGGELFLDGNPSLWGDRPREIIEEFKP